MTGYWRKRLWEYSQMILWYYFLFQQMVHLEADQKQLISLTLWHNPTPLCFYGSEKFLSGLNSYLIDDLCLVRFKWRSWIYCGLSLRERWSNKGSPPVWQQEAYHPRRSLCVCVGGGVPPSSMWGGAPCYLLYPGLPPSYKPDWIPPPSGTGLTGYPTQERTRDQRAG